MSTPPPPGGLWSWTSSSTPWCTPTISSRRPGEKITVGVCQIIKLVLFVRVKVPRYIAMVITSLQLLQMVVGCFVNYTAYTFKLKGCWHNFHKIYVTKMIQECNVEWVRLTWRCRLWCTAATLSCLQDSFTTLTSAPGPGERGRSVKCHQLGKWLWR